MPSRASSFPKEAAAAAAAARAAIAVADEAASGGVIEGTDNDMSRPQQWAILTEDFGMALHAYNSNDDHPVPEVFHILIKKRIWLVEGNWGERANLQRWADDMINTDFGASIEPGLERATSIDAGFVVYKIKKTAWPAITEILPAGLQVLTRETFKAWCDALKNFCDGNVAEAETTLRNARLMPA